MVKSNYRRQLIGGRLLEDSGDNLPRRGSLVPGSNFIITLENQEYMAMLREKLLEIKQSYRDSESK